MKGLRALFFCLNKIPDYSDKLKNFQGSPMKWALFVLLTIVTAHSHAQNNCVPENGYIVLTPGYMKPCCPGLTAYMANDGRIGGAQCVKNLPEANCVQEGMPKFVYPNAPDCCRGLVARRPSPNTPIGFADICAKADTGVRVNNSESIKDISPSSGVHLTDDPTEVRGQ